MEKLISVHRRKSKGMDSILISFFRQDLQDLLDFLFVVSGHRPIGLWTGGIKQSIPNRLPRGSM